MVSDQIIKTIENMSEFDAAEAMFNTSKEIYDFAKLKIRPLIGEIKSETKEDAVKGLYIRIYGNMCSIIQLNKKIHFQGIIMITRSIFEILIDLKLIIKDNTDDDVKKFFAFNKIEKFRNAAKIVDHFKPNPDRLKGDFLVYKKYISNQRNIDDIKNLKRIYYPDLKDDQYPHPRHWKTKYISELAKEVSKELYDKYYEAYPVMSWFTHGGSTCYAELSEDNLIAMISNTHRLVQEFFLDASDSAVKLLKLDKEILNYHEEFPDLMKLRREFIEAKAIEILKKEKK